jgi:hypothetical protein
MGPDADLCFSAGVGIGHGRAAPGSLRDSSLRGMLSQGASMLGRTPGGESSQSGSALVDCSAHGPRALDRALERATGGLIEVLNRGGGVELWCENRCQPEPLNLCSRVISCSGFFYRFAVLSRRQKLVIPVQVRLAGALHCLPGRLPPDGGERRCLHAARLRHLTLAEPAPRRHHGCPDQRCGAREGMGGGQHRIQAFGDPQRGPSRSDSTLRRAIDSSLAGYGQCLRHRPRGCYFDLAPPPIPAWLHHKCGAVADFVVD